MRKNLFAFSLIAVLLVCSCFTSQAATSFSEYTNGAVSLNYNLIGDSSGDGKINIKDATCIQKFLAKIETLDDYHQVLADIDGNLKVTVKDATAIQKHIAGMQIYNEIGLFCAIEFEDNGVVSIKRPNATITFKNAKWKLQFVFDNYKGLNSSLKGAEFALCKDGKVLDVYKTDENGCFTTREYFYGYNYTLRELSAPNGYETYDVEHPLYYFGTPVSVIEDGCVNVYTFTRTGMSFSSGV